MTLEESLRMLLEAVVPAAYPDEAPEGARFPYAIFQQIGGAAGWYVDNTMPDRKHARMQINVWTDTREQASALARAIENALANGAAAANLIAAPLGAFTSLRESVLDLYGTRQDFSIWYPDPWP